MIYNVVYITLYTGKINEMNKPIRIADIAKTAGVSASTVSAVLADKSHCYASESTKERIRQIAEKMEYVPDMSARRLRGGSTMTIGVMGSFGSESAYRLVAKLAEHLWMDGYQCLLADSRTMAMTQERIIKCFIARGIDALVLCDCKRIELPDKLPVLKINYGDGADIYTDRISGMQQIVEHLIKVHGHNSIVFTGPVEANMDKFSGFINALEHCGIKFSEDMVLDSRSSHNLNRLIIDKVKKNLVTAIVTTNDTVALYLINYLQFHGVKVPEDVAVTGFDDSPMLRFSNPPLTTVFQPVELIAEKAAAELKHRLAGGTPNERAAIKPEIRLRRSCGCSFDTESFLADFSSSI